MAPAKGRNLGLWLKMIVGGIAVSVGGPAFVYWIQPTPEQLRERFNDDLKKRNLEKRDERAEEFDQYVTKLKEYAKSDKPIWVIAKEEEEKRKRRMLDKGKADAKALAARQEEMRKEAGLK